MIEDLEENSSVKKCRSLSALKKIVGGDSETMRGSKPALAQPYLDVNAQVDVLVDLAADANVLGRQWTGLATWV